jgi:hypothetical protein
MWVQHVSRFLKGQARGPEAAILAPLLRHSAATTSPGAAAIVRRVRDPNAKGPASSRAFGFTAAGPRQWRYA